MRRSSISDTGKTAAKGSLLSAIERMIVIQLSNRFSWLAVLCGGLLILHMTVLQIRAYQGQGYYTTRMDTFNLLAALLFIIECVTLAVMLLCFLSEPQQREAWRRRWPGLQFSDAAAGLSSTPVQFILSLLLLLPMVFLHRYPELSAAQAISIPLMILQRWLLVFLVIQVAGNLASILRWFTPLPRWLCALLALAAYWGFGYWLTWASYTDDRFMRFNDVFFYNQLSRHIEAFPELMRSRVTFDIHSDFQAFFLWLLGAAVVTSLLWLPRALLASDRQERSQAGTQPQAGADAVEAGGPDA